MPIAGAVRVKPTAVLQGVLIDKNDRNSAGTPRRSEKTGGATRAASLPSRQAARPVTRRSRSSTTVGRASDGSQRERDQAVRRRVDAPVCRTCGRQTGVSKWGTCRHCRGRGSVTDEKFRLRCTPWCHRCGIAPTLGGCESPANQGGSRWKPCPAVSVQTQLRAVRSAALLKVLPALVRVIRQHGHGPEPSALDSSTP
jgi:hypothetical protein